MKNRIFFLVDDIDAAKTMVEDIRSLEIGDEDLHVIANESITLEPLPEADLAHSSDLIDAAKRGALTGGAMGLAGGVIAVSMPAIGLTLGGGTLLAGTALGTALGTWFSTLVGVSVPNQDVEKYRERIGRGEVMIIVDLDEARENRFTKLMTERHPDIVRESGNLDAA